MSQTDAEYVQQIEICRGLFENKMKDYGPAWRILRLPSLTDQIYIKANRIRTIQEKGEAMIDENEQEEFMGIVNYAIISLIQLDLGVVDQPDIDSKRAMELYDQKWQNAFALMKKKNHDYGEAWRDMRISSITDLILQKILRIKQIEDNQGQTLVSEGLEANYNDMLNYSIFSLILLEKS